MLQGVGEREAGEGQLHQQLPSPTLTPWIPYLELSGS